MPHASSPHKQATKRIQSQTFLRHVPRAEHGIKTCRLDPRRPCIVTYKGAHIYQTKCMSPTRTMQEPRVCDLFRQAHDGVEWPSPAHRTRAYIAFYQKVKRAATNAKRMRSYRKSKFEIRRRELVQQLNKAPGRRPRQATILKYNVTWDATKDKWDVRGAPPPPPPHLDSTTAFTRKLKTIYRNSKR